MNIVKAEGDRAYKLTVPVTFAGVRDESGMPLRVTSECPTKNSLLVPADAKSRSP